MAEEPKEIVESNFTVLFRKTVSKYIATPRISVIENERINAKEFLVISCIPHLFSHTRTTNPTYKQLFCISQYLN